MSRSHVHVALVLVAGAATASLTAVTPAHAVIPLKDAAMIDVTTHGYLYRAGQQDSHLVVTQDEESLYFVDTGTKTLKPLPDSCVSKHVVVGIAAVCEIPANVSAADPLTIEIWVRLGDDYVDGSALSDSFELSVLADAGFDVVRGGAGDDFVNGAQDGDLVYGGDGNDWIRTGIGRDKIWGDAGNDKLVGAEHRDKVHGGEGNDSVGGGPGDDRLFGDAGRDLVRCGPGTDRGYVEVGDKTSDCETVEQVSRLTWGS